MLHIVGIMRTGKDSREAGASRLRFPSTRVLLLLLTFSLFYFYIPPPNFMTSNNLLDPLEVWQVRRSATLKQYSHVGGLTPPPWTLLNIQSFGVNQK